MKIEINEVVNQTNIKIYRKYGIRKSSEFRHKCVICGEVTCIDNAFSYQGHKMTCSRCVRKRFSSQREFQRWLEQKEEGNE